MPHISIWYIVGGGGLAGGGVGGFPRRDDPHRPTRSSGGRRLPTSPCSVRSGMSSAMHSACIASSSAGVSFNFLFHFAFEFEKRREVLVAPDELVVVDVAVEPRHGARRRERLQDNANTSPSPGAVASTHHKKSTQHNDSSLGRPRDPQLPLALRRERHARVGDAHVVQHDQVALLPRRDHGVAPKSRRTCHTCEESIGAPPWWVTCCARPSAPRRAWYKLSRT